MVCLSLSFLSRSVFKLLPGVRQSHAVVEAGREPSSPAGSGKAGDCFHHHVLDRYPSLPSQSAAHRHPLPHCLHPLRRHREVAHAPLARKCATGTARQASQPTTTSHTLHSLSKSSSSPSVPPHTRGGRCGRRGRRGGLASLATRARQALRSFCRRWWRSFGSPKTPMIVRPLFVVMVC